MKYYFAETAPENPEPNFAVPLCGAHGIFKTQSFKTASKPVISSFVYPSFSNREMAVTLAARSVVVPEKR
jgi:hypothetical protein